MGKKYTIEIVNMMSVTRFFGKPALADIKNAIDDVSAIGEFQRRLWIFDVGSDLRGDAIMEIGQYSKGIWSKAASIAIVVPDDLSFGLARMHDVFREQEGVETRVFRTEYDAMAWLKKQNDKLSIR